MYNGNFTNNLTDAVVYLCRCIAVAFKVLSHRATHALWCWQWRLFSCSKGQRRPGRCNRWPSCTLPCRPKVQSCFVELSRILLHFGCLFRAKRTLGHRSVLNFMLNLQICCDALAEFESYLERVSYVAFLFVEFLFLFLFLVLLLGADTVWRSTFAMNSVWPASRVHLFSSFSSHVMKWSKKWQI